MSPTRQRAEQARDLAAEVLERLGMRLHPDRSGTVCLSNGRQGFQFLGFQFLVESITIGPGQRVHPYRPPGRGRFDTRMIAFPPGDTVDLEVLTARVQWFQWY
jgi:hypothetical protein